MTNEELYQKAVDAITALLSDDTVSVAECRVNLETLIGEIQIMIDSLPDE